MASYDELLEDSDDSFVFDADDEIAGFDPDEEESSVVIVEPPIIQIGRARRKDDMRKLQESAGNIERGNPRQVLPQSLLPVQDEDDE